MKPRFNQPVATAEGGSSGTATSGGGTGPRAAASSLPVRGMRSAWLKLQLIVAGAKHNSRLKMF